MAESATLGSRRIYTTEEHSEVAIPPEQFLEGGSLILYPEVAQKGVLAVHAKNDKLVLRATSWIGLIPINDHVVVEVRPKVSIHNLESILLRIDDVKLASFPQSRDYTSGETETPSLLDLLALRLANLVDSIRLTGLHFEYRRVVRRGLVVGTINPLGTAMLRAKTGGAHAISSTWERTVDTAPNRLIKSALERL